MSDRELLEMAAKAYADPNISQGGENFIRLIGRDENFGCDVMVQWNPLTNDGDALRLAVRLNLAVVLHPALNQALVRPYHTLDMDRECREDCEKHTDHFAATRRAIVRAAAEIGRQMQEGGAA